MNNSYTLSVVIPTFNRKKLLSYTLESLLNQTVERRCFEVVIADDGSTDDTAEMVEHYKKHLNIVYVYQEDKGYRCASARNLGISASSGAICLFIDAGVLLHENCIKKHIDFHSKIADGAGIGYIYGFEENDEYSEALEKIINPFDLRSSIESLMKEPLYNDVRENHYEYHGYKLEDIAAPWLFFWGCHISVKKVHLNMVDNFDENYDGNWGVEDNDLGFRLCAAGIKISVLRDALSIHYPHPKSKKDLHIEGFKNCNYFYKKFPTDATKVFLDNFLSKEFININRLLEGNDNQVPNN